MCSPRRRRLPATSSTPRSRPASSATARRRWCRLLQGELEDHAAKGRPSHRLVAASAHGDSAGVRRRRRRSLLELQDRLVAELTSLGRLSWAEPRLRGAAHPPTGATDPMAAWMKLKDARSLRARARAVARSVAAWRERRRLPTTRPCARSCPTWRSSASPSASRPPSTSWPRPGASTSATAGVARRGDRRCCRRGQGRSSRAWRARSSVDELDRAKRPAITLVSAWVSEVARDARIDTALLGRRADLVALLARSRRPPRPRVAGRAVGDGIRRLLDGSAGLTFAREGGLRLITAPTARCTEAQAVTVPAFSVAGERNQR